MAATCNFTARHFLRIRRSWLCLPAAVPYGVFKQTDALFVANTKRLISHSRDPRQAEEEAGTVRGNRAARARTNALNGQRHSSSQNNSSEEGGRTFKGDTLQGIKIDRILPSFAYLSFSLERVITAWKETPVKWYPIPALLGAVVLVGIQSRRNYIRDREGSRSRVVDENGKAVTASGPWTVR